MEYGKAHCGGCQKVLGNFPVDNVPVDLELYCDGCTAELEDDTEGES